MATSDHLCYVVDDEDIVIDTIERSKLNESMRWRNTGVYIFNDKGEVLLARRHPSKKIHPNCWGPSAAGTVEVGETYKSNMYKEIEEELGITLSKLKFHGAFRIDHGNAKRFTGMFSGHWNGSIDEISLEENEVAEVKWVQLNDLLDDININPTRYVPGIIWTLPAVGISLDTKQPFRSKKNSEGKTIYY